MVSIATRPGPHAEQVIFAAEAGVKGIYCEKSLCNAVHEMDAMLQACMPRGVKFNYGTQRRYAALYRDARAMIERGDIGEVQAVVANCGISVAQWGHTHAADMMLFFALDSEAEFAQGTVEAEAADWEGDRLTIDPRISNGYVQFKNGIHSYLVGAPGWEFEISGTEGTLRTLSNGMGYSLRQKDEHGELRPVAAPEAVIESGTLRGMEDIVRAIDEDGDTQGNLNARLSQPRANFRNRRVASAGWGRGWPCRWRTVPCRLRQITTSANADQRCLLRETPQLGTSSRRAGVYQAASRSRHGSRSAQVRRGTAYRIGC